MNIEQNPPVEVGETVTVNFPIGGARSVKVVETGRAGFIGENESGKRVTVRSYRLVEGLKGYNPPAPNPDEKPLVPRKKDRPVKPKSHTGHQLTVIGRGGKEYEIVWNEEGRYEIHRGGEQIFFSNYPGHIFAVFEKEL